MQTVMLIVMNGQVMVLTWPKSHSSFYYCFLLTDRPVYTTIMPPKKKDDGASGPPALLGRIGTNLKIGIVGLPNVG